MRLKIIGSGSAGNCYVLDNGKEALVIECGMSYKKVLQSIDFNVARIKGALISHEHGDHSKYVNEFLSAQISIYTSKGTASALNIEKNRKVHVMNELAIFHIGGFEVKAFKTIHDAAEPYGYLIYHPECGITLFATDTKDINYRFNNISNIMIECNYRLDYLIDNVNNGRVNNVVAERIVKSHMSFDDCLNFLKANDISKVSKIILIHLSNDNSNAKVFKEAIASTFFKDVIIADKDIDIEFNKTPF